jgi:hypothetical protein
MAESFNNQSPYLYADNNPIRYIDYMGMNAEEKDDEKEKEEEARPWYLIYYQNLGYDVETFDDVKSVVDKMMNEDASSGELEDEGDYFPIFNAFLSTTVSLLGGEAGVNYSIRQMKRLQAESMVLARNIGQKGPFGNFSASINKLKGLGTGLKWGGIGSGVAGIAFSGFQYYQGNIGVERFGLDATVSGFTLIPGVGPFIGLNYLIIDNTIGVDGAKDHMINHAIDRSKLIKRGINPGPGIGRIMR